MGHESEEYLPLANDPYASESSFGSGKRRTDNRSFASREKLLVLVILLQAIALVSSILTRNRDAPVACKCPYGDRPLLYCELLFHIG
jgi:hypothetical protein